MDETKCTSTFFGLKCERTGKHGAHEGRTTFLGAGWPDSWSDQYRSKRDVNRTTKPKEQSA